MKLGKNEIEKAQWWIMVFEYHGQELKQAVAVMYAKDCSDVSPTQLDAAWKTWRKNNTRAPLPANIRNLLGVNGESEEEISERMSSWVIECLGAMREGDELRVYNEGGPTVESAIRGNGGWRHLWVTFDAENRAQIAFLKRDLKTTMIAHLKHVRPAGGELPSREQAKQICEKLKLIPGGQA